jgi:signal transduction histidine kinase
MNYRTYLRPALMMMLFFVPVLLLSQSIESRKAKEAVQQLSGKTDTARIGMFLKISEEFGKSQPREAIEYAREALNMAEELKDSRRIGLACREMASLYTASAIYDKALPYLLKALDKFQELKDTLEMAACYDQLGVVHLSSGDFLNAKLNFKRSLDLNKKTGNHEQIARNYMNMGFNYLKADSVDKGLSYFMVSLMIADSLKMEPEKLLLLKNIGYGYALLGRHEEALRNFYKVLDLLVEHPDDLTRSEALVQIGVGYYHMKNYPAALKYATEGYKVAKANHFNQILRDVTKVLSDVYAAQGNYQAAYNYVVQYRDISDTILNAEKISQLARIQTLYEVNQKEEENLSLRQEIFQNIRRVRTRTLVIILITTLVILLAIGLYVLDRMNNKQYALNKKLAAQSAELQSLNDLKDKFFAFVAHNLKNPFNTIMGFAELMQRATESGNLAKTRQYSGLIYDLSAQVQKVLSNLLEWSRLQRRSFEVKPDTIELTGLIKDVVEMNNKEAARKDISLSVSHQGNIFVVADRTMVTTVLQNLVSNAINFTPSSGQISIDCQVKDMFTEVTVTDTGIGISEEDLGRIFDFDFSQSRIGSSEHGGAGLGLVICHEMLLKNAGTIHATSSLGKGSTFSFTLPVAVRHDHGIESEVEHVEKTPEDVSDALLASESVTADGFIDELRLQVVPLFDEVSKVLSIENLDRFARAIIVTGEKFHNNPLTGYGKSLQTLTQGHQIDQIIKILPKFRSYINKIMQHE